MKFTCNTKELSKACQTVSRAAATKASVPALEGIKIDVKGDKIRLCGYNLELGITTAMQADGNAEDGTTVLDAKTLCSIVKKLPDSSTTIESATAGKVTISSGAAQFEICGIPASEFPATPEIDIKSSVTLEQPILKSMIHQTIFAVAENDAKPVHTGALLEIESGSITMVGVDGYRLAKCHEAISYSGDSFDFVVPKATLMEISGLLSDDSNKMVTASVDLRHAIFEIGGYEIFTRLLEGEFLDYERCIPESHATEVLVDVKSMLDTVQRVSLIVNDKLRAPLRMSVNEDEKNRIGFECSTAIGAARDEVNAAVTGDALTIGFNGKYLSDALKNVDCDEVRLQFNGPLSSMVILPDAGDSFLFLVLPVRLKAS